MCRFGDVTGGANGLTGAAVVASLNSQLASTGITAGIANDGTLEFGGSTAFTVTAAAATGTATLWLRPPLP